MAAQKGCTDCESVAQLVCIENKIKQAGFNKTSLARYLGLHRNTVNNWCKANEMPKWAHLLVDALLLLNQK